jgi:hypothetical protein
MDAVQAGDVDKVRRYIALYRADLAYQHPVRSIVCFIDRQSELQKKCIQEVTSCRCSFFRSEHGVQHTICRTDIKFCHQMYTTPVLWAIEHDRLDVLRVLTDVAGAELTVNSVDKDGQTPLHYAANFAQGHMGILNHLLAQPGVAFKQSAQGYTPIDVAVSCGSVDTLVALCNAFPLYVGCQRHNLKRAVRDGHLAIVRFLLEHNKTELFAPLLLEAALRGHLAVLEYLVERNGVYSPSIFVDQNGVCVTDPIARVIRKDYNTIAVVDFMMKRTNIDVNSNVGPPFRGTALVQAVVDSNLKMVRHLTLAHGACVNTVSQSKDSDGINTALYYALAGISPKRHEIAKFLIQCGGRMVMGYNSMQITARDYVYQKMLVIYFRAVHQNIRKAMQCLPLIPELIDIVASYLPLVKTFKYGTLSDSPHLLQPNTTTWLDGDMETVLALVSMPEFKK